MNAAARKKETAKPISGVIGKILSSFGLTGNYNGWTVIDNWTDIVGKDISDHAQAINFEEGCLYVAVKDSSWRQQLSMQLEDILSEIHKKPYGRAVKSIRLVHGTKGN